MVRYLLRSFCTLALAGCSGGGDRFAEAAFQNRVDSAVNARLDSVQSSFQHRNDSLILEAARRRADSLNQAPVQPSPPPARSAPPAIPAAQP